MKRKEQRTYSVDFFVTLVTFLVYAGAMILLVYMGTAVYRSVTEQMELHYATRTAQAYITEKFHQNDKAGMIRAEEVDGKTVLALREEAAEHIYVTYIYEDGGYLKELFTRDGNEVSWADGSELVEMQDFFVKEMERNGFSFCLTDREGSDHEFVIYQESED